jgi:hypothetical protein
MQSTASPRMTLRVYVFSVLLALSACIYAVFKPGISPPIFPEASMRNALNHIGNESLTSTSKRTLNKDSSDRTTSFLYTYNYSDGSKIMAVMVRVKKRDDFKIETYGLLTKNIDPIYIKNSTIVPSTPPSLSGVIGKDKFIQTCIVPKTRNIKDSDFRLDRLTEIAESVHPSSSTFLDKIIGLKKHIDYSCLVLTYKPAIDSLGLPPKNWPILIRKVQDVFSF